jgi:tetratricopeptide (TPR) repeat protein
MLTSKAHMVVCPKLQELLLMLEKKKFRADVDTHIAAGKLFEMAGADKNNQALVRMLAADTMDAIGAAQALLNAAEDLTDLSALELALNVAESALKIAKRGSVEEATALFRIGSVHHARNEFDDAMAKFKAAVEIYEKAHGTENHQDVAMCYNNMGAALLHQNDQDNAMTHFKEAAQIYEKVHGEAINVAGCVFNVGQVLAMQNKFDKAQVQYEKALPIFQEGVRRGARASGDVLPENGCCVAAARQV